MKNETLTKRTLLAAGLFLLLGAGLPTKCSPPLSTDTLTGPVSKASARAADEPWWPDCPLYEFIGPPGYPGDRAVWTARVAAKDPDTRLFLTVCLETAASPTGNQSVQTGQFIIANKWGQLWGQVEGGINNDCCAYDENNQRIENPFFRMHLLISGGSGAYRDASGSLGYVGCFDEDGQVSGASIRETFIAWPPPACAGPPEYW